MLTFRKIVKRYLVTPPDSNYLIYRALGATLLAVLLSLSLQAPFSASLTSIFSSPERTDFTLPDIFAQIADDRPVRSLDDRIAIIDIGIGGREEIAEVMEILSLCGPKAVGLDVNFEEPGVDDERLIKSLNLVPNLVLPLGVKSEGDKFVIEDKPFFYGEIPGVTYGVVNIPTASAKSSVREFAVNFPMKGGGSLPSFVTAIARISDPQAVANLYARGKKVETTSYHSKEFHIYPAERLADYAEELTGKIVLVGSLSDAVDMHPTPINSYVPGLAIHAFSLSTLLDRSWFIIMPRWIDYTLAFIICYLIVLSSLALKPNVRGLVIRIAQILLVYITVRIGYWLYIDHNIICNLSATLLMIAFGLFAVDIWRAIDPYIINLKGTFLKKQKKNI